MYSSGHLIGSFQNLSSCLLTYLPLLFGVVVFGCFFVCLCFLNSDIELSIDQAGSS